MHTASDAKQSSTLAAVHHVSECCRHAEVPHALLLNAKVYARNEWTTVVIQQSDEQ